METKLKRIEKLSFENPKLEFEHLISHFNKKNLISCFHELDRNKARGSDGVSKDKYEENLEENIESLIDRMKKLKYYPAPVREVIIPKGNGKYRPLGISNFEDKIIQSMYAKILSAIYEPIFIEESYGFRPKRSCHHAIKEVHSQLNNMGNSVVIDVDLSNFFGTINHRKLIQLLEIKIKDRTFIRYIVRMLKAGVLSNGELVKSDDGSPQGSIVSPVLANIFAHYAIDSWLKFEVPISLSGVVKFVRYADDIVICTNKSDAPRITKALKGRLDRFSLILNEEKTKVVSFSKAQLRQGVKQGTFKFLGFTFYLGKARKGDSIVVKLKTAKASFAKKIKAVNEWCRTFRNKFRLAVLWKTFISKIRGHIQYYGVSHNFDGVQRFLFLAKRIFFKWMNRRSQKRSFNWSKFTLFEKIFPMPTAKIVHRLF